jgi:hypothetical protein
MAKVGGSCYLCVSSMMAGSIECNWIASVPVNTNLVPVYHMSLTSKITSAGTGD